MEKKTVISRYNDYTQKSSEIARNLAFSALVLFWVYSEQGTDDDPSQILKLSALLVVFFFITDISQYIIGAFTWREFLYRIEKDLLDNDNDNDDIDFNAPKSINGATLFLFTVKLCFIFSAYVLMIAYLIAIYVKHVKFGFLVFLLFVFLILLFYLLVNKFRASQKDISNWKYENYKN